MKSFLYSLALAAVLAPMGALAQWNPGDVQQQSDLPAGTITEIIINLMQWFLALVGIIGVIGFVISGILYFVAAGDEGKMGTAKNAMTYSIIGVIVALVGYVIIQAADALLGGDSRTF